MSPETDFLGLITDAMVPGIASTFIRNGRLDQFACFGVRVAHTADPVDENTVFEAASLGKPVFAHVVLQLVDQGCLSLDVPLGEYLPRYLPADNRAFSITPRQVLSHSSGLPNWRGANLPLKTYFQPGEQFSYSGEGFLYLQNAVETLTGVKAHTLAEELVFRPLAMTRSSFIWNSRLDGNRAYPHDAFGRPALSYKPGEANAAWSLQTTASDYAHFLLAVVDGSRLKPESAELWHHPKIEIRHRRAQCLVPSADDVVTGVAWGLGWGLEPNEGTFFHWGDNGPFTAFTIGSRHDHAALVVFANGASGLSIMPELVAHFMPGNRPSFTWLDYERHDSPVRRLLRAARARGIEAVSQEIENADLGSDDLRRIAQGLSAGGREEDSLWLLKRIEERSSKGCTGRG